MKIQLRIENGDSALACARLTAFAGAVRVKGTTRGCTGTPNALKFASGNPYHAQTEKRMDYYIVR